MSFYIKLGSVNLTLKQTHYTYTGLVKSQKTGAVHDISGTIVAGASGDFQISKNVNCLLDFLEFYKAMDSHKALQDEVKAAVKKVDSTTISRQVDSIIASLKANPSTTIFNAEIPIEIRKEIKSNKNFSTATALAISKAIEDELPNMFLMRSVENAYLSSIKNTELEQKIISAVESYLKSVKDGKYNRLDKFKFNTDRLSLYQRTYFRSLIGLCIENFNTLQKSANESRYYSFTSSDRIFIKLGPIVPLEIAVAKFGDIEEVRTLFK